MEAVVEAVVVVVDNLVCRAAAAAVVDTPEAVVVDTGRDTDSPAVFRDIDRRSQRRDCSVPRPCPSHWSSDSDPGKSNLVCPAVAVVAVARRQLLSAVGKLLAVVEQPAEGPCLVS